MRRGGIKRLFQFSIRYTGAIHETDSEQMRAARRLGAAIPTPAAIPAEPRKRKRPDMVGNSFWRLRKANRGGPVGNSFWRLRKAHRGPPLRFKTPELLWTATKDYFAWVDANPLAAYKVAQYQGQPVLMTFPKMRAMSLSSLCQHLGFTRSAWDGYRRRKGFRDVVEFIEQVILVQKFEGAAAGLFNPRILARELGLKNHKDVTSQDEPLPQITPTIIYHRQSHR